jgi:hypothetical protein
MIASRRLARHCLKDGGAAPAAPGYLLIRKPAPDHRSVF